MSTNSIAVYEILVRNTQLKGRLKYAPLDAVPDGTKKRDMYDLIHSFLKEREKYRTYLVNKGNRIVRVSNLTQENKTRDLIFFVHQGSYGTKSEIVSSKSLSKTYDKLHDEGDAFAHFAFVRLPKNSNRGLVLLHSIGNVGVKSWFRHYLETYIQGKMPHCSVKIRPLASEDVLKKWLKNADVKSIKVSHFEPEDETDPANYLGDDSVEKTLILRKSKGSFGPLSSFLNKTKKREKIVALSDEDCSDVTAEVVWNGRPRVVSLNPKKNPKVKFILEEKDVEFDDGAPVFSSFSKYAKKLAIDLQAELAGGA